MSEKVLSSNRKAKHEYFIEEEFCAGMVLVGPEVKSIMESNCSIDEAFVELDDNNGAWITNSHVDDYKYNTQRFDKVECKRKRKLLLNKTEINKLRKKVSIKGYTLIPIKLVYRNRKIKLIFGVAKGKKQHDKRNVLKEKQIDRDNQRDMKQI